MAKTEIAQESAVAQVQSILCDAIRRADISRSELSRRVHWNRSQVTAVLSSGANPSIKTIALLLDACGFDIGLFLWPRSQERKP